MGQSLERPPPIRLPVTPSCSPREAKPFTRLLLMLAFRRVPREGFWGARASRANFGASPKCFSIQLKEVVGEAPTTAREAACAPLTQIEVRAGLALQAKLRVLPGTP